MPGMKTFCTPSMITRSPALRASGRPGRRALGRRIAGSDLACGSASSPPAAPVEAAAEIPPGAFVVVATQGRRDLPAPGGDSVGDDLRLLGRRDVELGPLDTGPR